MEDLLNNSQSVSLPESMAAIEELQDGIVTEESTESTDPTPDVPEAEAPAVSAGTEESSSTGTDTDSSNNGSSKNPEGFEWGNGNGEVPPGQNVDEDGNIVNNGGNTPPGLNRRNKEKPDKDDNPNKPEKPDNPGSEDKTDSSANKAQQGTHIYTYDNLNRMSTSNIAKTKTTYTYDTLGNLVYEKVKNKSVDYQYNELNQLVKRTDSQNQTYTYQYDKRGNRIAETGKKESRAFVYDETNHLVEGTNWKGDKSAYTYNALFVRINNIQTSHSGNVYDRDYVIDYTSIERDDLMIYAEGNGQLDYVQREVYAGSERIEQFTDRSNGGYERTLYVHEDVQGNTRYYTKTNGNSFAELTYDAWGMPVSPNKLLNNDHGNYVYATYTGHIFDTTLDIYFAEARFYDAQTRMWLAMDPIKDGGNWYQYCFSNPLRYWDPTGLAGFTLYVCDFDERINTLSMQLQKATGIDQLRLIIEIRSLAYMKKNIAYSVSEEYIKLLKSYETGLDRNGNLLADGMPALSPYQGLADKLGTFTIGWGHAMTGSEIYKLISGETVDLYNPSTIITIQDAENILRADIARREKTMNGYLGAINERAGRTVISLNQYQYDAIFDLMYNVGESIFKSSDFSRYLEKGDLSDSQELKYQFGEYSSGGKNPGLLKRRVDELDIILEKDYTRGNDYTKYGDIFGKISYPNRVTNGF